MEGVENLIKYNMNWIKREPWKFFFFQLSVIFYSSWFLVLFKTTFCGSPTMHILFSLAYNRT